MIGSRGNVETLTRLEWSALTGGARNDVAAADLAEEASHSEPVTAAEVLDIYLPLGALLGALMDSTASLARTVDSFLAAGRPPSPFIIGIAGGVAVGKSTTARVLQAVLGRGPGHPGVDLLSTDAYLFPNRVLDERGLSARKGFPETYDLPALLEALASVRSGADPVLVPVYSHQAYDVLPDVHQLIDGPDILIVEGLNVLQTAPSDGGDPSVVSDFLDVALYVDATEDDAARWFLNRLMGLRSSVGGESGPFLRWFSSLPEQEARAVGESVWTEINLVNVRRHVAPTRSRAHLVLRKDADHRVSQVVVRRP